MELVKEALNTSSGAARAIGEHYYYKRGKSLIKGQYYYLMIIKERYANNAITTLFCFMYYLKRTICKAFNVVTK